MLNKNLTWDNCRMNAFPRGSRKNLYCCSAVNSAFNPQRLNTLYFTKRFRPKVVDSTTCAEFVLNYFWRIIIWLLKPSLYTTWLARANGINYNMMHILCTIRQCNLRMNKLFMRCVRNNIFYCSPLSLRGIIDIYPITTNLLTCLFDLR